MRANGVILIPVSTGDLPLFGGAWFMVRAATPRTTDPAPSKALEARPRAHQAQPCPVA